MKIKYNCSLLVFNFYLYKDHKENLHKIPKNGQNFKSHSFKSEFRYTHSIQSSDMFLMVKKTKTEFTHHILNHQFSLTVKIDIFQLRSELLFYL